MSELTGKIFDIQGFSTQDGPGIRTTIFFKGCPLHCPWCHSPESQSFSAQLCYMNEKCVGTKKCADVCLNLCPERAISYGVIRKDLTSPEMLQMITIDRDKCTDCGKCTEKCYSKALYICGKDYTVDEIVKEALKDLPFFESSGGGVTLSGGECLAQQPFALEVLKELKKAGIHTAVDTTGFVLPEKLKEVLPYADLFLYDIKHMDSAKHKAVTGVPNELILDNAEMIARLGGSLQIRIPVIPGFNNGEANMKATAEFCKKLGGAVSLIQLLPYHNMGTSKYLMLNDHASIFEVTPPSEKEMAHHKSIFEDAGLKVTIY